MSGPLADLKVVEIAGVGPAPFAAMLLADLGADVIRVDRPGGRAGAVVRPEDDFLNRGRRSLALDLKDEADVAIAQNLIAVADVLIEGYRPGVMERLGLGPDVCLAENPRLVYARMTGWGQDGPLARTAGHDIDFVARAGALFPIGEAGGPPVVPLNIVGDFGGGGMLLAYGVLAAVHHSARSGVGQVVDAAITDGTALLTTMLHVWRSVGLWNEERGQNLLDGGAHHYRVYETADGRHLAVGAIEPQFYERFVLGLGVPFDDEWRVGRTDPRLWPELAERVQAVVRTRSLADWMLVYDGADACVAPVLTPAEALRDPHNVARGTFREVDGVHQPAPAPRFSRTPPGQPRRQPNPGEHDRAIRDALAAGSSWPD